MHIIGSIYIAKTMAPTPWNTVVNWLTVILYSGIKIAIEKETVRKAGVLVLFYPSEAKQTMLALILRKTYKGVHSAQIGFPGGKYENEDNVSAQHLEDENEARETQSFR